MIDLYLLRLRYEILNVPISTIALETMITPKGLQTEADNNNWKRWWPTLEDLQSAMAPSTRTDEDEENYSDLSPLEDEANTYINEAKIRLQVFSLAKDLHLASKYAAFEAALVDKAHSLVQGATDTNEVRQLTMSLKDLPGKMAQAGLAISQGEDGMSTVIIRDLSGTR